MTDRKKCFIKIQNIAYDFFDCVIVDEKSDLSFICGGETFQYIEFEIKIEDEFGINIDVSEMKKVSDVIDFILEMS